MHKKLFQNIVVEDELVEEKVVGSKIYRLDEVHLFNADAAIALYTYLKENCLEWDAMDVHTGFFEDDDSGFIMIQYSGSVVWQKGDSSDLVAQFYAING
jgi:hypothetical protein